MFHQCCQCDFNDHRKQYVEILLGGSVANYKNSLTARWRLVLYLFHNKMIIAELISLTVTFPPDLKSVNAKCKTVITFYHRTWLDKLRPGTCLSKNNAQPTTLLATPTFCITSQLHNKYLFLNKAFEPIKSVRTPTKVKFERIQRVCTNNSSRIHRKKEKKQYPRNRRKNIPGTRRKLSDKLQKLDGKLKKNTKSLPGNVQPMVWMICTLVQQIKYC